MGQLEPEIRRREIHDSTFLGNAKLCELLVQRDTARGVLLCFLGEHGKAFRVELFGQTEPRFATHVVGDLALYRTTVELERWFALCCALRIVAVERPHARFDGEFLLLRA